MNLIADEDDMLERMVDGLMAGHVEALGDEYDAGCVLAPAFGAEPLPLRRRAVMRALQLMLGRDARVEAASVEAVLAAFDDETGGKPRSGYVANIQGDLAVSANKRGVRIKPWPPTAPAGRRVGRATIVSKAIRRRWLREAMLPLTSTRPTRRACCGATGRCA